MKIRKKGYSIVIQGTNNLVVLTRQNTTWVNMLQHKATFGITIYDCTFREAVENLHFFKKKGFDIVQRKERR